MSEKKWIVRLSEDERGDLLRLVHTGKAAAYKRRHAQVLLKADQGEHGPGWTDQRIGEAVECDPSTVRSVRKRFVEQGFQAALNRKKQKRPSRARKLDGAGEARLIAISRSEPPEGRARWTLRMLADRLVELSIVDSISHESVRKTLKKMHSSRT